MIKKHIVLDSAGCGDDLLRENGRILGDEEISVGDVLVLQLSSDSLSVGRDSLVTERQDDCLTLYLRDYPYQDRRRISSSMVVHKKDERYLIEVCSRPVKPTEFPEYERMFEEACLNKGIGLGVKA